MVSRLRLWDIHFCALFAYYRIFMPALLVAGFLGISYVGILPSWNALLASYVPEKQKGVSWGIILNYRMDRIGNWRMASGRHPFLF